MSPIRISLFSFALALLFTSGCVLWMLGTPRATLEVRATPRQLPAGKLFPGHAVGQAFRYPGNELSRIEVLFARQPGDSPLGLQLTLRGESASGDVLRTVEIEPTSTEPGPQYLSFEFEPLVDVEGQSFHFQVAGLDAKAPSDWTPWISWRGRPGRSMPWGDHTVPASEAEQLVKSIGDDFAAVALAVDGLNVPAGECRLEVRRAEDGELVRDVSLQHASPIAAGYAIFAFEPIQRSRWRDYQLKFKLPDDARVVAYQDLGISVIALHGAAPETEAMLGLTRGNRILPHRDLIFRASGATQELEELELLLERLPWPKLLGAWLLSWISSGLVLALFFAKRPDPPTAGGSSA